MKDYIVNVDQGIRDYRIRAKHYKHAIQKARRIARWKVNFVVKVIGERIKR